MNLRERMFMRTPARRLLTNLLNIISKSHCGALGSFNLLVGFTHAPNESQGNIG